MEPYKCIQGHYIMGKDHNAKCKICAGDKDYINSLAILVYPTRTIGSRIKTTHDKAQVIRKRVEHFPKKS